MYTDLIEKKKIKKKNIIKKDAPFETFSYLFYKRKKTKEEIFLFNRKNIFFTTLENKLLRKALC